MTDRAAFTAEFVDIRNIKGRKVMQLVFEIPVEGSWKRVDNLGGTPHPGQPVTVAIARLETQPAKVEKPKGPTPSQRAWALCQSQRFGKYLLGNAAGHQDMPPDEIAVCLRRYLDITSRGELDANPEARARFETLEREYQEAHR
jgi:hypothetical protein